MQTKPSPQQTVRTDVLVVGAGPTGLSTAIVLRTRGHNVMVIDKIAASAHTSRAVAVHARTMEVLKPYDITERLIAEGIRTKRFTFRDRDTLLVDAEFSKLPTEFPFVLFISQASTEAILAKRLTELGGTVLRPRALVSLAQDDDGVTATLDNGQTVQAQYVVGADGLHSVVRDQVGISFPEQTDALSFTLADVTLTGDLPKDEGIISFSGGGQLLVAPLPDGTFRVVANVDVAPEHPDVAFVQHLLDIRGPKKRPAKVQKVIWGSRFLIHHGVASQYVVGRVAVCGDAAHVHSPAGGQGMNLGIQDAVALGEALSKALKGDGPRALKAYEAQQQPIAKKVVAFTETLTKIATVKGAWRPIRNMILRLLNPFIRHMVAVRLSELPYKPRTPGAR